MGNSTHQADKCNVAKKSSIESSSNDYELSFEVLIL